MLNADHLTPLWREFPAVAGRKRRSKSDPKQPRSRQRHGKDEIWKVYLRALTSQSPDQKVFGAKSGGQANPTSHIRPAVDPSSRGDGKGEFDDVKMPRQPRPQNVHQQGAEDATPVSDFVNTSAQSGEEVLKRLARFVALRAENQSTPDALVDTWTQNRYKDERVGRILGYRPGLTAITEDEEEQVTMCNRQQSKEQRILILREEISGLWSRLQGIENELNLARDKLSGFKR